MKLKPTKISILLLLTAPIFSHALSQISNDLNFSNKKIKEVESKPQNALDQCINENQELKIQIQNERQLREELKETVKEL